VPEILVRDTIGTPLTIEASCCFADVSSPTRSVQWLLPPMITKLLTFR